MRAVLSSALTLLEQVSFADLQFEREAATGRLLYLPGPLSEVIRFNDDDPARVLADEDLACWYIAEWYLTHRLAGGEPDLIAEEIFAALSDDSGDGLIQ